MDKNNITNIIVSNALVAALYATLTLIGYPFSFYGIQFRFSEILVLLCFFRKDYAIGLILGCAIVNFTSPLGLIDVGIGTLATALACLGIIFCKQMAIACLFPILTNSFLVGLELFWVFNLGVEGFWLSVGQVALGETAVMIIAYIIYFFLKKRKGFLNLIGAKQNLEYKW